MTIPGFRVTRAGAILGVADFAGRGVPFLAEIHHPPWGGSRFFCVDPDVYLVEIEEPG